MQRRDFSRSLLAAGGLAALGHRTAQAQLAGLKEGTDFVRLPAQDSMMGFNEPVFINLFASTLATDDASSPLWISRSQHLKIINGYAAGWSKYQTIVHGSLDAADLELHTENLSGNVAAEFFLSRLAFL